MKTHKEKPFPGEVTIIERKRTAILYPEGLAAWFEKNGWGQVGAGFYSSYSKDGARVSYQPFPAQADYGEQIAEILPVIASVEKRSAASIMDEMAEFSATSLPEVGGVATEDAHVVELLKLRDDLAAARVALADLIKSTSAPPPAVMEALKDAVAWVERQRGLFSMPDEVIMSIREPVEHIRLIAAALGITIAVKPLAEYDPL